MVKPADGDAEGGAVVTVVYKVHLHCVQCAREIQKLDVDIESSEIKVKGRVNPTLIHEEVIRISKKKVEMVVLQPKVAEEKKKDPTTTTLKVHLHCSKCENDLKSRLLNLKDVYAVRSDLQAQTLTVEGTMESHKLGEYIHKKVRKHAEILTPAHEQKAKEVKKIIEAKKISEEAEAEAKKIEVKVNKQMTSTSHVPHIVYYHVNYAPQWFSDENPNACHVM
ncbi:hypothetical protein MKW94_019716 [Papaver nudicaule]|uniref:HMA domain-containing protein n=1 Tax=Papaver nudicaule TaxID=74823 RepID=A0AA42AQW9_PAPNU|nr:hypothetical protein [Papaver nudicaule]